MKQISMSVALVAATIGLVTAQDTLRFTPTVGYRTYAVREPVATIQPGTVLVSETNFGSYYEPGGGTFPGEVGPFYVEGATTDDILVVEIIKVRPNHDLAGAQIYSGFGGLASDSRLRLLNDPVPPRPEVNTAELKNRDARTEFPPPFALLSLGRALLYVVNWCFRFRPAFGRSLKTRRSTRESEIDAGHAGSRRLVEG